MFQFLEKYDRREGGKCGGIMKAPLGFRICVSVIVTILFSVISPGAIAQSLSSTLHNGQLACRGLEVTFTCVTRGSDAIAWTSDTYIGPGGVQLGFVAAGSSPGDIRTSASNADTLATLTREENDQGVTVLESTLSITPLPDPQNASVTCIHAVGGDTTAYFQVIGGPNAAEDIVPVQIQHEDNCVVHTTWRGQNDSNNILTQYEVLANGKLMTNETVIVDIRDVKRMSALFYIECGAHEVSINALNICGRTPSTSPFILAQTPSHSLPDLLSPTNPNEVVTTERELVSELVTTDDTEREVRRNSCRVLIGVSVTLSILLLIFIITTIIFAVLYCKGNDHNSENKTKNLKFPLEDNSQNDGAKDQEKNSKM